MPKSKAYNRDILRHLIDDEARGDSDIGDHFESTDDEEDVVSFMDDDLVDSDDDTAGNYSPNCCEEAIVDVFSQVTAQQRENLKHFNIPGFAQYPGLSWSLTVSKIGADIALPTLDAVFNFIVTFCNRGGLSMCGYITEDEGRPWYQCMVYNIPREDLQQGRLQHISAQTATDDGKVILTQRNFFSEMFKFSMRSLFPCICPVRVDAMYALQSTGYIPASDWVRKFSKVDSEEAQALWKASWNSKVIR